MNVAAVLLTWLCITVPLSAASYFCDPLKGDLKGDGSTNQPWPALEQVLKHGLVQLADATGKTRHTNAPVKPGDTLLLRSGWHGVLHIRAGYNQLPITIAAEPRHSPQVGSVEIGEGSHWILRGLTVSPSLAPAPLSETPRVLVKLGESGGDQSRNLVVEDCYIYSTLQTSNWTARDWINKPLHGIWLGRHGQGHIARNNHVLNTRFGIELCAPRCVAEGNIIENFSADGLRATRDDLLVQHNVIKNIFVSDHDGDANHDDGIQVFLFNVGTGTVRNITFRGNIILARENDDLPFPNAMQGIGCFDGPLVNFLVEDNVIGVNHYHGITLGDAQGCTVRNNTCFSRWGGRARPWIMIGEKKNLARGNFVQGNQAHSFSFKADPEITQADNREITEAEYRRRLAELRSFIDTKYGAVHPVSRAPRLAN